MARSRQKRTEKELEDGRISRRLAAAGGLGDGLGTPTKPGDDGHPSEDGPQPSRSKKRKKRKT